jgi:hypothetical protein
MLSVLYLPVAKLTLPRMPTPYQGESTVYRGPFGHSLIGFASLTPRVTKA